MDQSSTSIDIVAIHYPFSWTLFNHHLCYLDVILHFVTVITDEFITATFTTVCSIYHAKWNENNDTVDMTVGSFRGEVMLQKLTI